MFRVLLFSGKKFSIYGRILIFLQIMDQNFHRVAVGLHILLCKGTSDILFANEVEPIIKLGDLLKSIGMHVKVVLVLLRSYQLRLGLVEVGITLLRHHSIVF